MLDRRSTLVRITVIAVLFLVAFFGSALLTFAQPALAGQDDGLEEIDVQGIRCTDAACSEFGDIIIPFTVNVVEANTGELLDTCTVDVGNQNTYCPLRYDADVDHTFTWNEADVPAGFAPFGSPIEETGPTGRPILTFAFAPDGSPTNVNTVVVRAALCTDASCEEYAEFLSDFRITALEVQSDNAIDSCVTDGSSQYQGCTLEIPGELTYALVWNEDAIPDGYTETGSQFDEQGPGPTVQTLTFSPSEDTGSTPVASPAPTDSEVEEEGMVSVLPSTGAGAGVLQAHRSMVIPSMLVWLTMGLMAGAVSTYIPSR